MEINFSTNLCPIFQGDKDFQSIKTKTAKLIDLRIIIRHLFGIRHYCKHWEVIEVTWGINNYALAVLKCWWEDK